MALAFLGASCGTQYDVAVIISSDTEWKVFKEIVQSRNNAYRQSPFGQWFVSKHNKKSVVFFHGGWGKIDAAGSAQYIIDTFKPGLIVNIGTAGGFPGKAQKGDIILVNKTVTYDIFEKMSDSDEAIEYYSTRLDYPKLKTNDRIRIAPMVSADQDLFPKKIGMLQKKYGAIAGDWESSAIAHIAKKNGTRCYIIRGISDIVHATGSETYGRIDTFEKEAKIVMTRLLSLIEDEGKILE